MDHHGDMETPAQISARNASKDASPSSTAIVLFYHLVATACSPVYVVAGHGKSDGRRIDCLSFDHYTNDAEQFVREVVLSSADTSVTTTESAARGGGKGTQDEAPRPLPLFLFGHSMGSLVTSLLALRFQRQREAAGRS
jgi:pimeloyl-ACP methyl ester carboxylesterase